MRYFISLFFVLVFLNASAQIKRCGTDEYMRKQEADNPSRYANQMLQLKTSGLAQRNHSNAAVIIPVVFHILYNTTAQNISDEKIFEQLRVLNLDFGGTNADSSAIPYPFKSLFAKTGIQFCLATQDENGNPTNGIVRKQTSVTGFSINGPDPKSEADGGDRPWDAEIYLNIYSCNLSDNFLGYTQFPGGNPKTDGVVLDYRVVGGPNSPGSQPPYHLGRTATHEVGHWLGLRHVWGDDDNSCAGTDYIDDTPNQADENYGCPLFPRISCGNVPAGDMFINYLDYTDDDCMHLFTTGQAARMHAVLDEMRPGIKNSPGCYSPCNENVLKESSVSIKPNPSFGNFGVEIAFCKRAEVNLLLINSMGKIVRNQNIHLNYTKTININLEHNGSGMYVLVLTSDNEKVTRKLIVL